MFSPGKATAQRCFCAEQDTRPETGRPRAAAAELVLEQHFLGVVAACHNFLKRVSLDQVFVQPPEKL